MEEHRHNHFSSLQSAGSMFNGNVFNSGGGTQYFNLNAVQNGFLEKLGVTDPRADKARLLANKDDLLNEACSWVLEDPNFLKWRNDSDIRLLWIKGDPGKGKTMMMMALIDELSTALKDETLAYSFCQVTDSNLNSALLVLKGLMYLLAIQKPTILARLKQEYDSSTLRLDERNAFYELKRTLLDILQNPDNGRIVFMVDALDECVSSLPDLLKLIADTMPLNVKWIISSRYQQQVERYLNPEGAKLQLNLELNALNISRAVNTFIKAKVNCLARHHDFDVDLKYNLEKELYNKAEDTFLWVALACKALEQTQPWNVLKVLEKLPPGLEGLYGRMINSIQQMDESEECLKMLSLATFVVRPMHLKEIPTIGDFSEQVSQNTKWLSRLVQLCGSFLTIRNNTVYFVHQSAQDYLSSPKMINQMCWDHQEQHQSIARRLIQSMAASLHMDMADLKFPGAHILLDEQAKDHVFPIRYACLYWSEHVARCTEPRMLAQEILGFLQKNFLYWLEALVLLREHGMCKVIVKSLLETFKEKEDTELTTFLSDADEFYRSHSYVFTEFPLQIYISSLVFCPRSSRISSLFSSQIPSWIIARPTFDRKIFNKVPDGYTEKREGRSVLVRSRILCVSLNATRSIYDPEGSSSSESSAPFRFKLRASLSPLRYITSALLYVPVMIIRHYTINGNEIAIEIRDGRILVFKFNLEGIPFRGKEEDLKY